ncbi:MAG: alpha-galactosidase [Pseudomonadota bacterium]
MRPAPGDRCWCHDLRLSVVAMLATSLLGACPPPRSGPCERDIHCGSTQLCREGFCVDAAGQRQDLQVSGSHLVYRHDLGRIDLYRDDGAEILRGAGALATADSLDDFARLFSLDRAPTRQVQREGVITDLGPAQRLTISAPGDDERPGLRWIIDAHVVPGFFTFSLELTNTTPQTLALARTQPLCLRPGGGLFLGQDPARHRVLENGAYTVKDSHVAIVPGDLARNDLLGTLIPGNYAGHSVSSWNHSVVDLDGPAVWIAGALSFDNSSPVMNLAARAQGPVVAGDGRQGFDVLSLDSVYLPELKPLAPGESFASERFYVHPGERDALAGLEHYADALKRSLDVTLWTERRAGNRVPNGWNSWSGSGGSGGYGTDINEELILANCDAMARELRDWGMDWFQIDDGYEPHYGDWTWRSDRFPHGARWLSDEIRARGFKPGLWIAPLTLDADSRTVAEHPDWIADRSTLGTVLASGYELLDLTHPEVQEWLRQLFRTFRQDWNYDWLKMDFSYWALLGAGFHDATVTREQAYRQTLRLIREAIGDDTFFLAVSAMGPHYGLVDADRITLDNMPIWDWAPQIGDDEVLDQQGFKPTLRTVSRRYYLHNKVWLNHPDLIFFRSNPLDPSWPRVTLSEAQAFASFVALSGGIVKLGDRLVDLTAEQINTVRTLLPIYGQAARPLDLFHREFAETFHLRVDAPLDGYDETYDLVGLFHWGRNWDLDHEPPLERVDDGEERHVVLDLVDLGLDPGLRYHAYEFWTGTYLGQVQGRLITDVPSHSARVIALRTAIDRPQFVGWNRQITMGGTVLGRVTWDAASRLLHTRMQVAADSILAPFVVELAYHVGPGRRVAELRSSGARVQDLEATIEGGVLRVRFRARQTGPLELFVRFES